MFIKAAIALISEVLQKNHVVVPSNLLVCTQTIVVRNQSKA